MVIENISVLLLTKLRLPSNRDTQYYLKYYHSKCIAAITEYVERTLEKLSSYSIEAMESDQGQC